jgi:hypothetical protein
MQPVAPHVARCVDQWHVLVWVSERGQPRDHDDVRPDDRSTDIGSIDLGPRAHDRADDVPAHVSADDHIGSV